MGSINIYLLGHKCQPHSIHLPFVLQHKICTASHKPIDNVVHHSILQYGFFLQCCKLVVVDIHFQEELSKDIHRLGRIQLDSILGKECYHCRFVDQWTHRFLYIHWHHFLLGTGFRCQSMWLHTIKGKGNRRFLIFDLLKVSAS